MRGHEFHLWSDCRVTNMWLFGWVTVFRQVNRFGIQPTPRSTQPSIPPG